MLDLVDTGPLQPQGLNPMDVPSAPHLIASIPVSSSSCTERDVWSNAVCKTLRRKDAGVQASVRSQVIALPLDHEARVQGVAVGTGRGAFILIRHFRGRDTTRLGHHLKARKREDKGTPGTKCDGTERVEP